MLESVMELLSTQDLPMWIVLGFDTLLNIVNFFKCIKLKKGLSRESDVLTADVENLALYHEKMAKRLRQTIGKGVTKDGQ